MDGLSYLIVINVDDATFREVSILYENYYNL
jgi:hypothetical protein